ncbi:BTAD domain-containing putative transcriptional regulator [Actinoplanes sp. NPDC051861]|uniref:AfsR/SARP family transcriptional regulator n=1 Tax=Actinoplanes sp. NPDC051861 TaxID=3155170 RepID=UPI00343A336A
MRLEGDTEPGIDLGPGKQRCVLASLLLTPRQVVPASTLIDRVWGDTPPRSGTPIAPYATRLRRILGPVFGPDTLRYAAGGYLIDCDPDLVDLHRARRQVFEARTAEESGDDDRAAGLLLAALQDWGDEALAGVPGAWAERVRDTLGREKLDVLTRLGRVALRLGRAEEVAERLAPFAADHPTVEALIAVQMNALAAAGRPAQALETFARTRDAIAEQLGSDPGPELAGLHTRILRGDAGPWERGPRPGTPAQLPADPIAFTGRREELADLDRTLGGGLRVAAVTGAPGVGKSALAIHWGHRARHRFPDGQLYLNLRGYDRGDDVMSPAEAARNLLVALLPDRAVPDGLDARTGLLRSVLAGRRMLLVLDNARDAGHVRPLLPGAGGCAVVVTSRDRLAGLVASHGAVPVPLEPLDAGQARELLAGRLGPGRLAAEPCTVEELVGATAGLPLALVAVAARAALRARQPLAELAAEIRGAGVHGPDESTDPRTVFSWSYRALSADAARLFRLFGALPGPDLSAAAAASASTGNRTAENLAELVAASLISEHRPGRFVMHDLLRAYADELTAPGERDPAVRRLLDHHLHTGHRAALRLDPQREPLPLPPVPPGVTPEPVGGEAVALQWLAAEHDNLMALIRYAADLADYGWQLPWVLIDFLDRQGHWDDWIAVGQIAVAAAHRRGERKAEALAQRVLARGYVQLGRYDEAEPHYRDADRLYGQTGDLVGQAHTLFSISWMREQQGRYDDCLRHTSRALELYREAGHRVGEARALNALGWYLGHHGRYELTLRHCRDALALQHELGDRYGEAAAWDSIGWAHHHLGDQQRAVQAYRRALDLYRSAGDLLNEAEIREHLGDAYAAFDDAESAVHQWRTALALLEKLDHPGAAALRDKLSP